MKSSPEMVKELQDVSSALQDTLGRAAYAACERHEVDTIHWLIEEQRRLRRFARHVEFRLEHW